MDSKEVVIIVLLLLIVGGVGHMVGVNHVFSTHSCFLGGDNEMWNLTMVEEILAENDKYWEQTIQDRDTKWEAVLNGDTDGFCMSTDVSVVSILGELGYSVSRN